MSETGMERVVVINGRKFFECPYDHGTVMFNNVVPGGKAYFPSVLDLENHIKETHRKY